VDAGVPAATLMRLTHAGRLERVAHGLYRVPALPEDRLTRFMETVMWARGEAAVSHGSALEMMELCDLLPRRIHITVPETYNPRRAGR
jgi:predicted transcriptional regulator of viral defense system